MKYNTYDIPGVKYFFALGNQTRENASHIKLKNFFSLDDIDGLTIEELKELIEKIKNDGMFDIKNYDIINHITIITGVAFKNLRDNFTYTANTSKLLMNIVLELDKYENNEKIDEVIEKELLEYLSKYSYSAYDPNLKLIRCFLQRYRYNTMEEVDLVLSSKKPLKRVYTPK